EYRVRFEELAADMQGKCTVAWNDTYGGHWFAAGNQEVFDIARSADKGSNDSDPFNERRGYQETTIPGYRMPPPPRFLELHPPAQRHYRQALNPYLSPAAVNR